MKKYLAVILLVLIIQWVSTASASDFGEEPVFLTIYEDGKPVAVVLNDGKDTLVHYYRDEIATQTEVEASPPVLFCYIPCCFI